MTTDPLYFQTKSRIKISCFSCAFFFLWILYIYLKIRLWKAWWASFLLFIILYCFYCFILLYLFYFRFFLYPIFIQYKLCPKGKVKYCFYALIRLKNEQIYPTVKLISYLQYGIFELTITQKIPKNTGEKSVFSGILFYVKYTYYLYIPAILCFYADKNPAK